MSEQRLQEVVRKRKELSSKLDRLKGRLESAKAELSKVEEECRNKGIDPAKLDEVIEKLQAKLDQEVDKLEKGLAEAEEALKPFEG